jgi:hypothetical protein
MLKYLRQHGEMGQTAVLLALAMVGLLAIVGLALDGGMLYWNQRRAQNGADAAVIAGVTKMADYTLLGGACVDGSESAIMSMVRQYAGVNEVPNAEAGENVVATYLVENGDGDRVDLIYPGTGEPWLVGQTGVVPCNYDPVGLRVKASFPQQTFLAHIVGIAETNVTVQASAIIDTSNGCNDYVLLALSHDRNKDTLAVTGSHITVEESGIHSNGGIHIEGGGQGISLSSGDPVEYSDTGDTNIGYDKIECNERQPDGTYLSSECAAGDPPVGAADPVGLGDTFYRFEDFDDGFIWSEVDPSMRFKYDGIAQNEEWKIRNPDGTLKNGLYVVDGDVKLNGIAKEAKPWRVTIVARGTITISGGFDARPYARGVLFFSDSNDSSNGAINASGSSNNWAGMIAAPHGLVSVSGSGNSDLTGMIIGNELSLGGSDTSVRHHPNYCPPDPPKVLLIQ